MIYRSWALSCDAMAVDAGMSELCRTELKMKQHVSGKIM